MNKLTYIKKSVVILTDTYSLATITTLKASTKVKTLQVMPNLANVYPMVRITFFGYDESNADYYPYGEGYISYGTYGTVFIREVIDQEVPYDRDLDFKISCLNYTDNTVSYLAILGVEKP